MTPRVIILSDGRANEGIIDREELCEHAGELRMRGVLTSCLGIGDGYDEQLLRGLAENGGGRLHDAELTDEISWVLLGELDDIFGTVVEDAQIELRVPAGVQVEVLGRTGSQSRGGGVLVPLGPVQVDIERVAVLKVTCPMARQNDELEFELTASGRAVDGRARLETDAVRLRLRAADGAANEAQSRDIEIAAIVARTWSGHIVTTVARMNGARDYHEAQKYIKGELDDFRRYVEGLDLGREMIRELEVLSHRAGRRLSDRMLKEMVVQSSLMAGSRIDRRGTDKLPWSQRLERGD